MAVPTAWFFAGWLFEAVETVLLRVLGAPLGFIEGREYRDRPHAGLKRRIAVPVGLGVSGRRLRCRTHGARRPDVSSVEAAFVVLKRTKELSWVALGYALLAADTKVGPRTTAETSSARA
jgi:hypothetical protein